MSLPSRPVPSLHLSLTLPLSSFPFLPLSPSFSSPRASLQFRPYLPPFPHSVSFLFLPLSPSFLSPSFLTNFLLHLIRTCSGGIGITSTVIAFLVTCYYTGVMVWCLSYLFQSFQYPLPWSTCPIDPFTNASVFECQVGSLNFKKKKTLVKGETFLKRGTFRIPLLPIVDS